MDRSVFGINLDIWLISRYLNNLSTSGRFFNYLEKIYQYLTMWAVGGRASNLSGWEDGGGENRRGVDVCHFSNIRTSILVRKASWRLKTCRVLPNVHELPRISCMFVARMDVFDGPLICDNSFRSNSQVSTCQPLCKWLDLWIALEALGRTGKKYVLVRTWFPSVIGWCASPQIPMPDYS